VSLNLAHPVDRCSMWFT